MKTMKLILLTIVISTFSLQVSSQSQRKYIVTKSAFEVSGTSNIHDWTMKSEEGAGTANLVITNSKLTDIKGLEITLPAESIKSGKSSMDDVAYESLDTKTYKNINYALKSAHKINETTWMLTGTYTIAGISKDYETQVRVSGNGSDTLLLQGSNRLSFLDFEITPPSAALGVVKAGKELTVLFDLTLTDYAKNENTLVIK